MNDVNDKLSKRQNEVFEAAKALLEKEPWYRGVCIDNFPSDEICETDFDRAVSMVYVETAYHDDPSPWAGD